MICNKSVKAAQQHFCAILVTAGLMINYLDMDRIICCRCGSDQTEREGKQCWVTCLDCGLSFDPSIGTVRTTYPGSDAVMEKRNCVMVTFVVKPVRQLPDNATDNQSKTIIHSNMDDSVKGYIDELKGIIEKSHDSFERQLNYISSGALGLSMLFIEKVVKDISQTRYTGILIFSWAFFAMTLISNLISHIFTANLHDKTLKEIDSDNYDYLKARKRNKIIKIWNFVSICLLSLGIIFQIIFISINL